MRSYTLVDGTPPLAHCGRKRIPVDTLDNVAKPTRCRQPLNSIRLMVCYIFQNPRNDFLNPPCAGGGVLATCATRINRMLHVTAEFFL